MRIQSLPVLLAVAVVVAAAAFVGHSVFGSGRPPEGPVDIIWDHQTCAHCAMHIGEPGFAVQAQTEAGDVLFFDDPGCAFLLLDQRRPAVRAMYFHHHTEDRWLPAAATGFVPVAQSPMGFGYAAVDAGSRGALSLEDVRGNILQRSH